MRHILVTGAATWTGGRLIEQLARDPANRIFAVDDVEPRIDVDAEFERLSIDRLDFARYLLDVGPHVVVHLQTVDRSTEIGGPRAHEENVVGAQALFGAIGRSETTRQVLVKSDSAVYGASSRNPSVLTVDSTARGRGRYERDLAEMEEFVRAMAEAQPDVEYTVLRFAPIIGAQVRNPISRYLTLPAVPTLLGFDPRLQVIHEEDAVAALASVIDRPRPGTFNVAAPGQLYLSRILRLGRRVPQPLPKRAFESALRGLARVGLALPRHVASLLKHGRVMDVSGMREPLGFAPGFTCRQSVLATYKRITVGENGEPDG